MDNIQPDRLDEQLNEGLDFQHDSCYYCNGYYGPNFGEPICGTCHDFLYYEDVEQIDAVHRPLVMYQPEAQGNSSIPLVKDGDDSGNDEPSEETTAGPIPVLPRSIRPDPNLWVVEGESPDAEDGMIVGDGEHGLPDLPGPVAGDNSGANDGERQGPPPPEVNEKLARRIALLTLPSAFPVLLSNNQITLPTEMWSVIFRKLDATSVLMISKVCSQWKKIIGHEFTDSYWEQYVKSHWPLFHPIYAVESWYSICSDLIDSLPCKPCFLDMSTIPHVDTIERPFRQARLSKEIRLLKIDHREGIEAVALDEFNYNWLARMRGPPDSPYQGGVFYLNLKIHSDYPLKPPVVRFLTKIFHPNVSRHGDIGVDCIQHNWIPSLTVPHVLLSVQSLLTDPCTEPNMEASAASLYRNDRKLFDKVARLWTWKYAMHEILLH